MVATKLFIVLCDNIESSTVNYLLIQQLYTLSETKTSTAECPHLNGFFRTGSGDCGEFKVCHAGVAVLNHCPPGLVFNFDKDVCDWPINVPGCTQSRGSFLLWFSFKCHQFTHTIRFNFILNSLDNGHVGFLLPIVPVATSNGL